MLRYSNNNDKYLDTVLYIETDKGSGTGFVFHKEGYAITCAHVVKDADEIYVRIGRNPDAIEMAKVLVLDERIDLAILDVEGYNYCSAELEIEKTVQLGADIIILGFPFGAKMADDVSEMSVSFTRGYISSLQTRKGRKEALLDISAKAGNSGSPVVDISSGRVVGVLSGSILGGVNNREEVNYMIPISNIIDLMED